MHPRKAIREAFAEALDDATAAKRQVFPSRLAPITLDMLRTAPALMIYVRSETIAPDDYPAAGTGSVRRRLEVAIEGVCRGRKTVDDDLDALAGEVEAVLEDWQIPGFGSAEPKLIETEIDVSEAFEEPVGSVTMMYEVYYRTPYRADKPGTTPDDVFAEIGRSRVREPLIDGPGNGTLPDA